LSLHVKRLGLYDVTHIPPFESAGKKVAAHGMKCVMALKGWRWADVMIIRMMAPPAVV
jgi:hypothetical protein